MTATSTPSLQLLPLAKQWDKAEVLLDVLARTNQDQASGLLFKCKLAMAREDYNSGLKYGQAAVQPHGRIRLSWLAMAPAQQATGDPRTLKASARHWSVKATTLMRHAGRPSSATTRSIAFRKPASSSPTPAGRSGQPALPEMEVQYELNYGDPEKAVPQRGARPEKSPTRWPT
jgi:hypothetical protein